MCFAVNQKTATTSIEHDKSKNHSKLLRKAAALTLVRLSLARGSGELNAHRSGDKRLHVFHWLTAVKPQGQL